MRTVILGSRIYQPLTDIDAAIRELPPDATVTACGASPVCERAVLAATSFGLEARHVTLDTQRATLLDAASRPDATVWLFVAIDPSTKQPTSGISAIETLLRDRGVAPRVFRSPLPGRVCDAITRAQEAAARAHAAKQEGRRRVSVNRALAAAQGLVSLRDEYAGRMDAGWSIGVGDEAMDARWVGWERAYRACCDALRQTEGVLTPEAAA